MHLDHKLIKASWNLAHEVGQPLDRVADEGPLGLHGKLVNLPTRAVTGHNWSGIEHDFKTAPDEYAAVHFHEDDIYDCDWEPSFVFTVPGDLPSGIYAARVRATVDGYEEEDYIPFCVRPGPGKARARIALLLPTATYLAYSNDNMAADGESDVLETTIGSVPVMGKEDLARHVHREYGLSTYDTHVDGSGVCYTSWLRPMLNVRPKYRHSP